METLTHVLHDEPPFLVDVQRYPDPAEVAIELMREPLGSWLLLLDRLGSLQPWEETSQQIQKKSIRYVRTNAIDRRMEHVLGCVRVSSRRFLLPLRTNGVTIESRRPQHGDNINHLLITRRYHCPIMYQTETEQSLRALANHASIANFASPWFTFCPPPLRAGILASSTTNY